MSYMSLLGSLSTKLDQKMGVDMPKFEVKFHTLIETRVLVEAKNEEQAGFAVEDGEGIVLRIPQQLFVEIKSIKQREPDNG
jgi:hypothetical protein